MHYPRHLIAAFAVCVFLFCAGCTQGTNSPASGSPASSGGVTDITRLTLNQVDIPPNFTLVEETVRNPGDVGSLAKNLGWETGYNVRYATPALDKRGPTEITQSIAVYPEKSIPTILSLSDRQDRSDTDLTYTDLPVPRLGNNSRGFFGNASAQILVKPTNENPLASGPGSHDVSVVYTREVAEIIFAKGTFFEVLRMEGPGINVTVLQGLAEKAFRKLP